jgi:CheY-specific phosphatase CheX
MQPMEQKPSPVTSVYSEALAEVVQRVLRAIFGLKVRLVEHRCEAGKSAPFEVSGIIGMTGSTRGNIVLSFPIEMARRLTAFLLGVGPGEDPNERDIADCIGELSNIVAGNLLTLLDQHVEPLCQISLPSVVLGSHRVVWGSKDSPCDLLVFDSELGTFAVETNLRDIGPQEEDHASSAPGR